jgi:hypothetical protein
MPKEGPLKRKVAVIKWILDVFLLAPARLENLPADARHADRESRFAVKQYDFGPGLRS